MKKIILNPFEKYSETKLSILGVVLTLVGTLLAFVFNVRYDGILDLHFVPNVLISEILLDNLVNISCLVLFLYLSAIYVNKKTRFIDILTTSMIARFPLYLLPFANINGIMNKVNRDILQAVNSQLFDQISSSTWVFIVIFIFFTILFSIWYIALLYNGYKVASNAKGKLPIVLFVMAILFAEILSKTLIYNLN